MHDRFTRNKKYDCGYPETIGSRRIYLSSTLESMSGGEFISSLCRIINVVWNERQRWENFAISKRVHEGSKSNFIASCATRPFLYPKFIEEWAHIGHEPGSWTRILCVELVLCLKRIAMFFSKFESGRYLLRYWEANRRWKLTAILRPNHDGDGQHLPNQVIITCD